MAELPRPWPSFEDKWDLCEKTQSEGDICGVVCKTGKVELIQAFGSQIMPLKTPDARR